MSDELTYCFLCLEKEMAINPDIITEYCLGLVNNTVSLCKTERLQTRIMVEERYLRLAQTNNPLIRMFFLSAAVYVNLSATVFEEILAFCSSDLFLSSTNALFYIYEQLFHLAFKYPQLATVDAKVRMWELLDRTVNDYIKKMDDIIVPIEKNKRNDNLVFVLTDQFVLFQHGPTKTAADRCKVLIEKMGKTVLLINTAECLCDTGQIPFYNAVRSSYIDDYTYRESIEWKGVTVPFFQCHKNMPNYEDVLSIITMVKKYRPCYVISIGGNGLTSNIIAKMVPTLTVGLCPSDISPTLATCQTISYDIGEKERVQLNAMNIPEYHLIKSVFTSSINEEKLSIRREQIGLSSNSKVLVIIGGRLTNEIDEAFMEMLKKIEYEELEIVIMGKYDEKFIYEQCGKLKSRIHCIGFVQDSLSYMSVCDIYVNPNRKGGGTSCVEAMSLGLPVVTLPDGDVCINAGMDFSVENYDKMAKKITEYCENEAYYKKMSSLAKERSEMLLNSEEEFVKTMAEFEKVIDEYNL